MAIYSSTLASTIPWTEESGRLQSMGLQRVGHDLATEHECKYVLDICPLSDTCFANIFF